MAALPASIDKPANIPVVLAFPSILYQTRIGGYQAEISLPLGMVVNAIFKNQHWLYVQTPHAEEGYVSYAACLPLGIIPPPENNSSPCWENSTDVFPKPCGNMTDTEKLSSKSECSVSRCHSRTRNATSACGERSVDRLYLRAAASAKNKGTRQTLLVMTCDYEGYEENTLNVLKGEVVALISTHLKGWFWVRNKEGVEGFIPAAVAGHGFL
ncbi:sh3-like domain superfamily [Holotrichia oblita]|uniref:Sh3-like domain superfamily n=1 Tax=Holotrichia oblita TaxID=644536 RepID=A0ACB9T5T5_HOLOL|nr:sh3-like domain superfamily [Holotrichia oblita]